MNTIDEESVLARDLRQILPAATEWLAALHARLIAAAGSEGILDIAYRVEDTPVGPSCWMIANPCRRTCSFRALARKAQSVQQAARILVR